MHYLQNSWFIQNGLWVFVFALTSVSVISYMNNRRAFMKKSLFALCFVILLAFGNSVLVRKKSSLTGNMFSLISHDESNRKVESGSLWSNFVNYIAHIVAERVQE